MVIPFCFYRFLSPKAKDALAKVDERKTSAMKGTITVSVFTAPSNHPI